MMNKTLIVLILLIIVLSWNFIFTSEKKVDLTDQAKILQGLSQAISYKAAVNQHWREKFKLPTLADWQTDYKNINIDTSKSLVEKIETGDAGVITVYFKNKQAIHVTEDIDGRKIVLTPTIVNNKLSWICTGNISPVLLPKRCQYKDLNNELN